MTNKEPLEYLSCHNKKIILVGTAHISKKSVQVVQETIIKEKPDLVAIELCQPRFDMLINEKQWENTDIVKILKEKKLFFLIINILLSSFQKKAGKKLGIKAGSEMLAAYNTAKQENIPFALIDRKAQTTLLRIWNKTNFWTKAKLFFSSLFSIFSPEPLSEKKIEELKNSDQTQQLIESIGKFIPDVKKYLIDERDTFMAQNILDRKEKKILAVVGAGHIFGMKKILTSGKDPICKLQELNTIPPKRFDFLGFIAKWSIPTIIILLIIYGFNESINKGIYNLTIWFLINGIFSSLGVILGGGYYTTMLYAFLMAPITSVTPFVGVAYFVAYAEVYRRKPTVKDLKEVKNYINELKKWKNNRLTKILYISLLSSIGSTIATFIAASIIVIQ